MTALANQIERPAYAGLFILLHSVKRGYLREGCEGHEVALPRSGAKGIAETKWNPKQPDPLAFLCGGNACGRNMQEGHALKIENKISINLIYHGLSKNT